MPERIRIKVPANGRVVIPAEFREALGIAKGGELIFRWEDDELRIATMKRNIERAQRHVRQYVKPGVSLVDELIADRRREVAHEK